MLRCLLALLTLCVGVGCAGPETRAPRQPRPKRREARPPPAPRFPVQPGKDALRGWALRCFEQGLKHSPIFGKGGHMVIRWAADRRGDLLHLDFATDTFRGWEIDEGGETLADCITRQARSGPVRWSPTGTVPLRFASSNAPPATEPAPAADPGE